MSKLKNSRPISFLVITLIYIIASAIGIATFYAYPSDDLYIKLLVADIISTLFVWLTGIMLKNSSVYDPYWSVAPIVIVPILTVYLNEFNMGTYLLMFVIFFWGIRLTLNWAYTFRNLNIQDWRYTKLHDDNTKLWFITNLVGINLVPTIVVFLVMLPAFEFMQSFSEMNPFILLSSLVCVLAVILQLVADTQMHRFKKDPANIGRHINVSVWKYVRHPNYLGEIMMWWGVYFMLLSVDASLWIYAIGPLCNTLLFLFISIPLMESRQLKKIPEYIEYKENTGMLLPKMF